jgi:hypothetical protein
VWGFTQYQQENAVAHYKRGEELKSNNDLIGAQRELKACLVECPDGWQKNTAREELERIEPLIAAQGKPQQAQPSAEETERQQAVLGTPIDYPTFFAKIHTGLPIEKRYRFNAVLSHDLCIMSDSTSASHLFCGTRADFDSQAEYESLLRGNDRPSGTIVASMGADGTVNIHSFQ